jgi:3-oxoacyl-[acyl-carrier protein] reductase
MATNILSGKVALITGSSKGIGKAIAIKYASQGAKVVVNFSGDESAAASVVEEIGSSNAIAIRADVSNVEQIGKLVDETIAHFGKLDVLVCNAGILPLNELENVTEEEFDRVMAVNVKGPLFLAKAGLYISTSSQSYLA